MIMSLKIFLVTALLSGIVTSYKIGSTQRTFFPKISDEWITKSTTKKVMASVIAAFTLSGSMNVIPASADQRLNAASAGGTRVNSDPESLLRYGLPIKSKEARDLQKQVELIKADLLSRRLAFAKNDLQNVKKSITQNGEKIVQAMPANHLTAGQESLQRFKDKMGPVENAISQASSKGTGSQQERDLFDAAFKSQLALARELSTFEELLVPDDFKREIPEAYRNMPALQGRAEVDMVIVRPGGEKFDVEGKLYDQVDLKMILDGYNAPITAGNFVDLVKKGFYDNKPVTRSDGFVVQAGDADPAGTVHGYIPPGAKEERIVPLEIALKDDPEILYDITSEDDGRGAIAVVLPFQAYGAMGSARSEYEANSASSQFFWLLFDSDLTPAGKNMLDGRYACFGYTVENSDLLKDVREGDMIKSAKVVKGLDKL
eukprot:CAMPEP_0182427378 /NCGR_PEP_ID=MMETSP1167-20130531/17126_1 /TAXON_ID=2988 /ORGANISM="Mallomonas Sp, Strain CCMP3275" /LENGTH=430 /DNA_ID=CAMNT_0024609571 /DNA_START=74 /DNA_END=1362 /DNA_ORIENTATION=+